jgi:LuxR family maltose regulon positive regulatory protein
MEHLLRAADQRPGTGELARILLRALDSSTAAGPSRVPATTPEALSDREVEVLRLLATDLTGPEISRQLFMSVNTFRTHTRHIFTKLDVKTRRAAVRRAADVGLL